jgi:hypothetical protein
MRNQAISNIAAVIILMNYMMPLQRRVGHDIIKVVSRNMQGIIQMINQVALPDGSQKCGCCRAVILK